MYQLKASQTLPISIMEAWDFFSSPRNLKVITPPFMGFDIVSGVEQTMFPGQIIQYKVSPVAGVKTNWVTEITHVNAPEYFVDEQRFGPYSFWHHKHFFKEAPLGTLVIDIVDYRIPAGILGDLMHPILVKPKLDDIFSYRAKKLEELFGSVEDAKTTLEIKSV